MNCSTPRSLLLRQQLHPDPSRETREISRWWARWVVVKLYDLGTAITLAKLSRFVSLVNGEVAHFQRQTVVFFIVKFFMGDCLPRENYICELVAVGSANKILVYLTTPWLRWQLKACFHVVLATTTHLRTDVLTFIFPSVLSHVLWTY